MLFPINQRVDVVGRQLKSMPMRDRIRWARFDAVPAENAAAVINVVDTCETFARRNARSVGIFRGFDVNAIRGAGSSAKKTSNALFKAGFVPV